MVLNHVVHELHVGGAHLQLQAVLACRPQSLEGGRVGWGCGAGILRRQCRRNESEEGDGKACDRVLFRHTKVKGSR